MANCFTITRNEFDITAGRKIIKSRDYLIRSGADGFIDEARRAVARMQSETKRECRTAVEKCRNMKAEIDKVFETARREGYQEGYDKAQQDYAAEINGALIDRAAILDQLENSLVDMLVESLRIILEDMGSEKAIRGIAVKALRKAGRNQYVKLRVHPERREGVERLLGDVKNEFEGLEWIEVVADAGLQPADCLLQTAQGILDFSLDTQLRVLRESLHSRVNITVPHA